MFDLQERCGQIVLVTLCEGCSGEISHGHDGYVTWETNDSGVATGAWHTFHLRCGAMGRGDDEVLEGWRRAFVGDVVEMISAGMAMEGQRSARGDVTEAHHVQGLAIAWEYWRLGVLLRGWQEPALDWVRRGMCARDFGRLCWMVARYGGDSAESRWTYLSRCSENLISQRTH